MSEYNMSHTGSELDEAIAKVLNGYILPSDSLSITENGTFDVTKFKNAVVNVSNMTKHASGYVTLSSNLYGAQTTYDDSKLKIDIGFTPKVFIFRPADYDASASLGLYSDSYNILGASVNFFDDFIEGGSGESSRVTTFVEKLTVTGTSSWGSTSVSISISGGKLRISQGAAGTGFYVDPSHPTEVYFYCKADSYLYRSGTWYWEAYA